MKEYFIKCNPKFFSHEDDTNDKNDDENDQEVCFEDLNMEKEDLVVVKKEYLNYPCRGCLQSSDQVVSLYESFDNILLLHKFTECTSISVS